MSESVFFKDLAVLTALAGFIAFVFSRLGWPKALGYILVGVLMNGTTWGGAFLTDETSIQTLSQLGVVFLMFGMGLNFSAKDMKKIKPVVFSAALLDVLMMCWLGYVIGTRLFGWSTIPSLFLGVAICDSATTLLAKVFDEMGWSKRPFTKYVLGTSVCEDIFCVGVIAVATGCAKGGGLSLSALALSLGGLGLFFLAVLAFGLMGMPKLLRVTERRHDDETLVLVLLGVVFLVSYVAYAFEFSMAMGAFLVGLLCATCAFKEKLDRLVEPFKALFSAMFFVTIGLLVNPAALWHHLPQILLVSFFVVAGKACNIAVGFIAKGQSVKAAVQSAFALAQIGEFAFMTAMIYAGLTKDFKSPLFQIAVGTSLLTTLLNPVMIRLSEPAGDFVCGHLPRTLRQGLAAYRLWLEKIRASRGSLAYILAKRALIRLGVYAALMVAVAVSFSQLIRFDYSRFSVLFERYDKWIFFFLSNVFCVGCLPLVVSAARALGDEVAEMIAGGGRAHWRIAVVKVIRFAVLALVMSGLFILWSMLNVTLVPSKSRLLPGAICLSILVLGIFGWRILTRLGRKVIMDFRSELTAEERRAGLAEIKGA